MDSKDVEVGKEGSLEVVEPDAVDPKNPHSTPIKRAILLAIFVNAAFIGCVLNAAAIVIAIHPIAVDLDLDFGRQTWSFTAYGLTFAGFLLFAGRLSDLVSASWVFVGSFSGMAILNLAMSFSQDKYVFIALRALCGICGAGTLPSAIRLVTTLYPDKRQQTQALTLFALSASTGSLFGVLFMGVFLLASWRWFLRFLAIYILPLVVLAVLQMPRKFWAPHVNRDSKYSLFRRLDPGGAFLITSCLLLFILSMTQGTVLGFSDKQFIAPFVLSFATGIAFFVWEWLQPSPELALLPASTWRLPGFLWFALVALLPLQWYAGTQTQLAIYWESVSGYSAILTAVRILPQGIAGISLGILTIWKPQLLSRPNISIPVGAVVCCSGVLLLIYSDGGSGTDYWRYMFPGQVLGAAGGIVIFMSANVGVILAVESEAQAVAGGFVQTVFQIGGVTAVSVQAGLTVTSAAGIYDWRTSQNGFWFIFAFTLVVGLAFPIGCWRIGSKPSHTSRPPDHQVAVA